MNNIFRDIAIYVNIYVKQNKNEHKIRNVMPSLHHTIQIHDSLV